MTTKTADRYTDDENYAKLLRRVIPADPGLVAQRAGDRILRLIARCRELEAALSAERTEGVADTCKSCYTVRTPVKSYGGKLLAYQCACGAAPVVSPPPKKEALQSVRLPERARDRVSGGAGAGALMSRESRDAAVALGGLLLVWTILVVLGKLALAPGGCTVAGSTCGDADACPLHWTCERGRCSPPPPPPPEPHDHLRDGGNGGAGTVSAGGWDVPRLGCPTGNCEGRR